MGGKDTRSLPRRYPFATVSSEGFRKGSGRVPPGFHGRVPPLPVAENGGFHGTVPDALAKLSQHKNGRVLSRGFPVPFQERFHGRVAEKWRHHSAERGSVGGSSREAGSRRIGVSAGERRERKSGTAQDQYGKLIRFPGVPRLDLQPYRKGTETVPGFPPVPVRAATCRTLYRFAISERTTTLSMFDS